MKKVLELPVTEEQVRDLNCGDLVYLSGTLFTARDAVHKFLYDGGECPVELNGTAVYHCGPVTVKDENGQWQVTAAGPTTSIREEPYMAKLIAEYGIRAVIGKGGMGTSTLQACINNGCVYLNAVGGCAQLLADRIEKVEDVFLYDEFGAPEAVWQLKVKEFPAVVTMDSKGQSLHESVEQNSSKIREEILNG